MEKVVIKKDVLAYGLKKNEEFVVKRNIMKKCVIIMSNDVPNIILSEKEIKKIGVLTGTPELCFA